MQNKLRTSKSLVNIVNLSFFFSFVIVSQLEVGKTRPKRAQCTLHCHDNVFSLLAVFCEAFSTGSPPSSFRSLPSRELPCDLRRLVPATARDPWERF